MKKQSEPEPQIMVCVRCEQLKIPVSGAIKSECAECREPIWVSPSSQQLIGKAAAGAVAAICEQCFARRMKSAGLEKVPGAFAPGAFAPGALGELLRHFKGTANN